MSSVNMDGVRNTLVEDNELYSVGDTARKLGGVSKWTIRSWLSQGRLERTKVGARTMISGEAIQRFLAACAAREANR